MWNVANILEEILASIFREEYIFWYTLPNTVHIHMASLSKCRIDVVDQITGPSVQLAGPSKWAQATSDP